MSFFWVLVLFVSYASAHFLNPNILQKDEKDGNVVQPDEIVDGILMVSNPDDVMKHMTTAQMIQHRGYPSEEHNVTTEDGYILVLFRIPYAKKNPNRSISRPVILMMHGMEDSSDTWVMNEEEQSAGLIFSEAGFDVWLGNVRGNTYSKYRTNATYDTSYWHFSVDEMIKYDLDALFNAIEGITGQRQIYYMGHRGRTCKEHIYDPIVKIIHELESTK